MLSFCYTCVCVMFQAFKMFTMRFNWCELPSESLVEVVFFSCYIVVRTNLGSPPLCNNHDDAHIRVGEYCFIFSAKRPLPPIVCERPLNFVKGHHTLLCAIIAFVVKIYWCARAFKRLRPYAPQFGIVPHFVFKLREYHSPLPV